MAIVELQAQSATSPLDEDIQQTKNRERVQALLKGLSDREREVISLRFGLDGEGFRNLGEIGRKLGFSEEYARQVQNKALTKLGADTKDPELYSFLRALTDKKPAQKKQPAQQPTSQSPQEDDLKAEPENCKGIRSEQKFEFALAMRAHSLQLGHHLGPGDILSAASALGYFRFAQQRISGEAADFADALSTYKHDSGRNFPSWSEVLWVMLSLGYQKLEFRAETVDHARPPTE